MGKLNAVNLNTAFIVAGIVVWAGVAVRYLYRRPCLNISRRPDPDAVEFGPEALVLILLLFLMTGLLVQQFFPAALSRELATDLVGKIVALAGMVALLSRHLNPRRFFGEIKGNRGVKLFFRALTIFFAIYPLVNVLLLSVGLILVEKVLRLPTREIHRAFELLSNPKASYALRAACIVLAVIISPIAEEFFFRGLLQNLFYKLFRRPIIAIIITGFCFSLVHIPYYQNLPALWMLGIILGWSYYRYQTLAMPVLIHAIFNGASILLWWVR